MPEWLTHKGNVIAERVCLDQQFIFVLLHDQFYFKYKQVTGCSEINILTSTT